MSPNGFATEQFSLVGLADFFNNELFAAESIPQDTPQPVSQDPQTPQEPIIPQEPPVQKFSLKRPIAVKDSKTKRAKLDRLRFQTPGLPKQNEENLVVPSTLQQPPRVTAPLKDFSAEIKRVEELVSLVAAAPPPPPPDPDEEFQLLVHLALLKARVQQLQLLKSFRQFAETA